ncbi:hypothetical protein YK56LOC_69460 [Caballeronia sp. HLA56]
MDQRRLLIRLITFVLQIKELQHELVADRFSWRERFAWFYGVGFDQERNFARQGKPLLELGINLPIELPH